jgi:hypothetical protein
MTPGSELISRSAPRGNEKPYRDAHWSQIAMSLAVIAFVLRYLRARPSSRCSGCYATTAAFRKVNDLNAISSRYPLGGLPECPESPLCLKGLSGQ